MFIIGYYILSLPNYFFLFSNYIIYFRIVMHYLCKCIIYLGLIILIILNTYLKKKKNVFINIIILNNFSMKLI